MATTTSEWTRWSSITAFLGGKGMPVRILIADDDTSIRYLLRRILEERPGWEVCGEATTGNDAVAKTKQLSPDLAIIDLAMPDQNGIEAARQIFATSPLTPMLLLTVQEVSTELARAARDAGTPGRSCRPRAARRSPRPRPARGRRPATPPRAGRSRARRSGHDAGRRA